MMAGMKGMKQPKRGPPSSVQQSQNLAQMTKALPPHLLKQMGGPAGLAKLVQQMEGRDLGALTGKG